jgi:hypothetical protein
MYCILNRLPCHNDCSIKHFKLFEAHYGSPGAEKFTELCDGILKNPSPGPPVDCDKDFVHFEAEGACYEDITWFQQTFGKIVVRPGIKLSGRGKTLETIGNFGDFDTSQEPFGDGTDHGLYDDDVETETVSGIFGYLDIWIFGYLDSLSHLSFDIPIFGYLDIWTCYSGMPLTMLRIQLVSKAMHSKPKCQDTKF